MILMKVEKLKIKMAKNKNLELQSVNKHLLTDEEKKKKDDEQRLMNNFLSVSIIMDQV